MPMIDMAKTPAEVKDEVKEWDSPTSIAASVNKYPWGLSISLDQDSLEKLGLAGELPQVGNVVKFSAEARVTSVSSSERENGDGGTKQCSSVELQIVRMALPMDEAQERAARGSRWYGSSGPSASTDSDND